MRRSGGADCGDPGGKLGRGGIAIDAMRPGLISDIAAVRADAEYSRWLGFDGVDFYHPAFIEIANEVFTPKKEELEWADSVLARASVQPDQTASRIMDGRVVLPQHVEIARRLKQLSEKINVVNASRGTK